MRWPWQRKEENRVAELRVVRQQTRAHLDVDLGDIEFNRRRAEELRQQAQKDDG